jgi:hypothetical protein
MKSEIVKKERLPALNPNAGDQSPDRRPAVVVPARSRIAPIEVAPAVVKESRKEEHRFCHSLGIMGLSRDVARLDVFVFDEPRAVAGPNVDEHAIAIVLDDAPITCLAPRRGLVAQFDDFV